jgi:hypothetical protein
MMPESYVVLQAPIMGKRKGIDMLNPTMNRKQRRTTQARARRDEKTEIRSHKVDPGARVKARRAFEIIKRASYTNVGTRPGIYSECVEGMAVLEALRQRGISKSDGPLRYRTLAGQQMGSQLADATVDSVLAVLIHERPDHKWSWDIVVDVYDGVIFGSPEGSPCESREDAEEGALSGLGIIGATAEPAPGYEPVAEPDDNVQIRVNNVAYIVEKICDDAILDEAIIGAMRIEQTTYDGLMARFANLVLVDGADNHLVALTILANCGWTHVTPQILEDFCAANGVDMYEAPSTPATAEPASRVVH